MDPNNPYTSPQTPQTPNYQVGQPPQGSHQKPGRGTLILVMGLLGIIVCFIFGILAWIWGKQDLAEMDAGIMDPTDRGITKAGYILGIIGCVLGIIAIAFFGIVIAGAGASGAF